MVLIVTDQVLVERDDLAALLDPTRPTGCPSAAHAAAVARLRVAAEGPGTGPERFWDLLRLDELRVTESTGALDQFASSLRADLILHGVVADDPATVHVGLAVLDHLRRTVLHVHGAGRISNEEAGLVLAAVTNLARVLARWAPPGARP